MLNKHENRNKMINIKTKKGKKSFDEFHSSI